MDSLKDKMKVYFGARPSSRQPSPSSEFPPPEDPPPYVTTIEQISNDFQQQQQQQQNNSNGNQNDRLSRPPAQTGSSAPSRRSGNRNTSPSQPPPSQTNQTQAPAWQSFFGIRRTSRDEAASSSSRRNSTDRHHRRHSSPNRRSRQSILEQLQQQQAQQGIPVSPVAINRRSNATQDPEIAAFQRPLSYPQSSMETPAPVSRDLQSSGDYKFPNGQPIRIKLIPYNPYFPTIEKEFSAGMTINIGRYQRTQPSDDPYNDGVYFRSTVVSRKHAQLSFINGEFFIKDTKSLGGTFINSTRISPAGKESINYKIFHGDVIQFGVDYRPDQRTGQVRNKDKCVEVILEFPQVVQKKRRNLPKPPKWDPKKHNYTECCICISALYTKQALFIAPCAHTFHYRCIAPLLRGKGFSCPMCRQETDLQESVWSLDEVDSDMEEHGQEVEAGIYPTVPIQEDQESSLEDIKYEHQHFINEENRVSPRRISELSVTQHPNELIGSLRAHEKEPILESSVDDVSQRVDRLRLEIRKNSTTSKSPEILSASSFQSRPSTAINMNLMGESSKNSHSGDISNGVSISNPSMASNPFDGHELHSPFDDDNEYHTPSTQPGSGQGGSQSDSMDQRETINHERKGIPNSNTSDSLLNLYDDDSRETSKRGTSVENEGKWSV